MLTFSLAQLNFIVGDLSGNVVRMEDAARKAAGDGARIVVFTEQALTGYPPEGLLGESVFLSRVDAALLKLCDASRATPHLYWVVGAPTRRKRVGGALENSLLVLKDGKILLQHAKRLSLDFGVSGERISSEPKPSTAACLEIDGTRVGFLIGGEVWGGAGKADPFAKLAAEKPDFVIVIDASPSFVSTRKPRHARIVEASRQIGCPMAVANQVGGHDQLVFDGASFAATPEGVVFEAPRFEESVSTLCLREGAFLHADGAAIAPLPAFGLPFMEFCRRQIVLGLRDYVRRCSFGKVVVGSSGGLDSALVLALAVEALGPKNVIAVTLPSRFSSAGSVDDSVALCRNLGIKLFEHPIHDIVMICEHGFGTTFGEPLGGLALENLQARARGMVLMEYSNQLGAMLLSTGNKSEISVGFCTLYGDTNGGLAPIGDLYKTEAIRLARYINEYAGCERIPNAIIDKPPSAELAPNQKDSDRLPPYPALDTILKAMIEGEHLCAEDRAEVMAALAEQEKAKGGMALIARVQRMVWKSEFKRRQLAPVLRLRPLLGGNGRRLPIAAEYDHMSIAIPAMYGG
ncbi:MAG: NAD(+) synthase [Azoarcus sp.]|jgi:NAD+ synthase/NAD+ synthase (glutamine-hydrolysing)|nr:NAD(+) synthase [Azoarcus sp.]